VKERVYVPPLPDDLDELRNRITAAVKSLTEDILRRVWDEFSYRVDVVRTAGGGHIEHLQLRRLKLEDFLIVCDLFCNCNTFSLLDIIV